MRSVLSVACVLPVRSASAGNPNSGSELGNWGCRFASGDWAPSSTTSPREPCWFFTTLKRFFCSSFSSSPRNARFWIYRHNQFQNTSHIFYQNLPHICLGVVTGGHRRQFVRCYQCPCLHRPLSVDPPYALLIQSVGCEENVKWIIYIQSIGASTPSKLIKRRGCIINVDVFYMRYI